MLLSRFKRAGSLHPSRVRSHHMNLGSAAPCTPQFHRSEVPSKGRPGTRSHQCPAPVPARHSSGPGQHKGCGPSPTQRGLPSPKARCSPKLPRRGGGACAGHGGDSEVQGSGLREETQGTPGAEQNRETTEQSTAITTLSPGSLPGPTARVGHSLGHGGGGRSRAEEEETRKTERSEASAVKSGSRRLQRLTETSANQKTGVGRCPTLLVLCGACYTT